MSSPTKLILRVYLVAIAGWLLHVLLTRAALAIVARGGGELSLLPLFLIVDVVAPPVLLLVLAYAVVRAWRDLVRQPDLRIATNIGMASAGAVGLVLGAWTWYLNVLVRLLHP